MDTNKQSNEPGTDDGERDQSLQELTRLTNRYKQLTWRTSAMDQKERASLDTTIMKLYSSLFPRSRHAWHEDFEVVVRSARFPGGGAMRTQAAATD